MPSLQPNYKFATRYLLKKLIGVGGYSQVWLAEDIKAGNMEVAIKIYAPEKGLDSDGIEIFGKEFTLVFNLNHANLLRPMHYDVNDGSPYFVMQYCLNGSLFKRIGEIKEKELAQFMQQASSALKYLHNQDPPIIHQDIKPDNFLIDNQGNYLLADFGISSKIRRTLTKSMGAQASTGTLAYMPPEKFSADKQIIKAGDIFSLGVTIYELLTGDLPYGDNGGLTLKAGAEVPNLPGNFSPELNHLLRSCLAKEPWERPTAKQLEDVAGRFLQTGQWPIVGMGAPNTVPESLKEPEPPRGGRKTEPFPPQKPESQSQNDPPRKKKLTLWISAVVLTVVVIGIVITVFMPKGLTAHDKELKRLTDSIRIADSIAMVNAEQQRVADSIVKVQQNKTKDWVEKNPSITNNTTTVQNSRFKIGDLYAGGIIFLLDKTGEHGKVCAETDQSKKATWNQAKTLCANLNLNGHKDWYLPSKAELNEMFKNLHNNTNSGLDGYFYWSSTEYGSGVAWGQFFEDGTQNYYVKDDGSRVRAIRAF